MHSHNVGSRGLKAWFRMDTFIRPVESERMFVLPDHIGPHCLLSVDYPGNNAHPYRPWHDTFRELSDIAEEL